MVSAAKVPTSVLMASFSPLLNPLTQTCAHATRLDRHFQFLCQVLVVHWQQVRTEDSRNYHKKGQKSCLHSSYAFHAAMKIHV